MYGDPTQQLQPCRQHIVNPGEQKCRLELRYLLQCLHAFAVNKHMLGSHQKRKILQEKQKDENFLG